MALAPLKLLRFSFRCLIAFSSDIFCLGDISAAVDLRGWHRLLQPVCVASEIGSGRSIDLQGTFGDELRAQTNSEQVVDV